MGESRWDVAEFLLDPEIRNTFVWEEEVSRLMMALRLVEAINLLLILTALVAAGIGAALYAAVVWFGLPPAFPALIFGLAAGALLAERFYGRRGSARLFKWGKALLAEKETTLTAAGVMVFKDLPGYGLLLVLGRGDFRDWCWGTMAELKESASKKLQGRLLNTLVPTATVSSVKIAPLALTHFCSELAQLAGEAKLAPPVEALQEISLTAQMLSDLAIKGD